MDYFTSSKKRRRSKKNSKKIKKLLEQEYKNHIPFINNPWPWDYAIEATGMPVNVIEATRLPVNVIEATRLPVNVIETTRLPVSAIEATRLPSSISAIEATRFPSSISAIEATAQSGNSEFCECSNQPSWIHSWIQEAQQQLRTRDETPEWKQYSQNIRDQQDRLQHDRLVQAENEAWELIERGQRRPLYFEPSPFSDFVRDAQEQLRKRDNLR